MEYGNENTLQCFAFPSKEIQKWGINFGRKIVEFGEVYTWNFVDQVNAKYPESMGITNDIKNITPPLRLFFYPYAQSSVDFKRVIVQQTTIQLEWILNTE